MISHDETMACYACFALPWLSGTPLGCAGRPISLCGPRRSDHPPQVMPSGRIGGPPADQEATWATSAHPGCGRLATTRPLYLAVAPRESSRTRQARPWAARSRLACCIGRTRLLLTMSLAPGRAGPAAGGNPAQGHRGDAPGDHPRSRSKTSPAHRATERDRNSWRESRLDVALLFRRRQDLLLPDRPDPGPGAWNNQKKPYATIYLLAPTTYDMHENAAFHR